MIFQLEIHLRTWLSCPEGVCHSLRIAQKRRDSFAACVWCVGVCGVWGCVVCGCRCVVCRCVVCVSVCDNDK